MGFLLLDMALLIPFDRPFADGSVAQAEWDEEFARYKTFPEWQQRRSMTLEEFKFIYFWEVRTVRS